MNRAQLLFEAMITATLAIAGLLWSLNTPQPATTRPQPAAHAVFTPPAEPITLFSQEDGEEEPTQKLNNAYGW